MQTFTWEEIEKMNINKVEFAKKVGIECTYDTALPQTWLNNFVRISGLDYHKVLFSTFATYPKNGFGMEIVSGWKEAKKWM